MIKMTCNNCYTIGGQIAASYNIESHGSLSATYESMANADIPQYAHGFYSPTEHESVANLKYNRTEIGYDAELREIKRAIEGAPLEAYVPRSHFVEDSGSGVPKTGVEPIVIKNPDKRIVEEIIKAQREVAGREIILQDMEIEEIIIKRRVRKRQIIIKKK